MNISDIIKRLECCGYKYDLAATQIHYYTMVKSSSLLKEQVNNRNSTGWAKGEYIIAYIDGDNKPELEGLLNGWKKLAGKHKNQYLILEVKKDDWRMYDYDCNELGGSEYIMQRFYIESKSTSFIQKIYYGCPGSGKSHCVNKIVENEKREKIYTYLLKLNVGEPSLIKYLSVLKSSWILEIAKQYGLDNNAKSIYEVDSVDQIKQILEDENFKEKDKKGNNMYSSALKYYIRSFEIQNVFRTTFHPDTDYASFVGCYKPLMEDNSIKYAYVPQVFTQAYVAAWKNQSLDIYLVIEEINRGNCAQIFGDLFQLLDRKESGESEYPITADKDLADFLKKEYVLGVNHDGIKDGRLKLPSNLHIYATMNTSDQSLFPMDSAFKRRWDWEYVPINYDPGIDSGKFIINIAGTEYLWVTFLKAINEKIYDATNSEDKQMGNFFIKKSVDAKEFINKVMFYLWNEVCKEEYGTQRNFFRKGKDGKTEFKFTELFGADQTTILNEFMTSLGVEPTNKPNPEEPGAE